MVYAVAGNGYIPSTGEMAENTSETAGGEFKDILARSTEKGKRTETPDSKKEEETHADRKPEKSREEEKDSSLEPEKILSGWEAVRDFFASVQFVMPALGAEKMPGIREMNEVAMQPSVENAVPDIQTARQEHTLDRVVLEEESLKGSSFQSKKEIALPSQVPSDIPPEEQARNTVVSENTGSQEMTSVQTENKTQTLGKKPDTEQGDTPVQQMAENDVKHQAVELSAAPVLENRPPVQADRASEISNAPMTSLPEERIKIENLPQKIYEAFSQGRSDLEIGLEPRELGKLTLHASFEDGHAVVTIECNNAKTAEMLSSHAHSIGTILEMNLGSPTKILTEHAPQENTGQDAADAYNGSGGNGGYQEQPGKRKKESQDSFLQRFRLGLG